MDSKAEEGTLLANNAAERMHELQSKTHSVADMVNALAVDVSAINSALDVIKSVSEQTNLLALNAAIEAARAGEHGRGFAVVADEVRQLAQRTQNSASEIDVLIEKLQAQSQQSVAAVSASLEYCVDSEAQVSATRDQLSEIREAAESLKEINTLVAVATEEQSAVIKEVSENIVQIKETSQQTVDNTEALNESSRILSGLADELDTMVGYFTR